MSFTRKVDRKPFTVSRAAWLAANKRIRISTYSDSAMLKLDEVPLALTAPELMVLRSQVQAALADITGNRSIEIV